MLWSAGGWAFGSDCTLSVVEYAMLCEMYAVQHAGSAVLCQCSLRRALAPARGAGLLPL